MPHITSETPRDEITIAKRVHTVPRPYAEGHVLSANEASALNQVFAENIRNNFASTIKDHDEAGTYDAASIQAALDEYTSKYEFGVRSGGGGRASDPVHSKAMDIARGKVREAITKKGHSLKDFSAKQISELAVGVLEKYPEITEVARAQVAAEQALAGIELGGEKKKH